MKDFKHWGIKTRKFPEKNYNAIWHNLKTLRLGSGVAEELDYPEFYDVAITSRCNLECPFCYVGALKTGKDYTDIVGKAKFFFEQMSENERPFQIAIGSTGEPTLHSEFCDFLETVYNLGIVPNYTTNGTILSTVTEYSEKLLEYTNKYVGGVALSANYFNDKIEKTWQKAFKHLVYLGNTNINLHFIISNKDSVDKFLQYYSEYKDDTLYFVLLPLMPSGRSSEKYDEEAFKYLLEQDLDWSKIAFGAHFYDALCEQSEIKCYLYPPESLSKNLILDDVIKITPSSFNLNPIKEIIYEKV